MELSPYVPVAQRRAQAAKEVEKLKKKGRVVTPVVIEGRKIAQSFWGKAWCDNLERYSDFESRLPRGRTYVRNGSVIDLQIAQGKDRRARQRLRDLQDRDRRHADDAGALARRSAATAPAPSARWSNC